MSSESHVAFYKALKFWIALLLAALAAALVWRLFSLGGDETGKTVEVGHLERPGLTAEATVPLSAFRIVDSAW